MIIEGDMTMLGTKNARIAFIRRVYLILLLQLTFMLAFVAICFYVEVLRAVFFNHAWLLHASYVQFGVVSLCFFHIDKLRYTAPWNYISITLFTLSLATIIVFCANLFQFPTIVNSLVLTVVIALVATLIASQGILDFTSFNVLLTVVPGTTLILTLFFFFVNRNHLACLLFLVAIAFSLNLLQCTQLILGNAYKYALRSDEYLGAAMFLYNDVIILLMSLSFIQFSSKYLK